MNTTTCDFCKIELFVNELYNAEYGDESMNVLCEECLDGTDGVIYAWRSV